MPDNPYLKDLNEEQRQAVQHMDGPLLVLSGAGTGKTRVLTTRLAHIIAQGKAMPWQCLAVTFTNKAASEMRVRLAEMVPGSVASEVWLGTFHSIGAKVLRRHADILGYKKDFTIINEDDSARLVKQIMVENDIDIKENPPSIIADIISRFKDKGLNPDEVSSSYQNESYLLVRRIYPIYQKRMMLLNVMDFGDLILQMFNLFLKYGEIGEKYQNQFKYIMVDEYQDSNVIQYLWLKFLAKGHGNLCCVGDDDQSIYSWRGAEIANILRFEKDYQDAKVIRLESNYRSTENLLGAASALIANNRSRLGKTLRVAPNRDGSGEKITLKRVWSGRDEANFVGNEILKLAGRTSFENMVILVRSNAQTIEFEDEFIRLGIGYKILGGTKFYDRAEIKDAIAYLRIIYQPLDDLALLRIINKPKRSIGDVAVVKFQEWARSRGISVYQAIQEMLDQGELRASLAKQVEALMVGFSRWRGMDAPLEELLKTVLEESGYMEMLLQDKSIEAKGRIENLQELCSVIAGSYGSIGEFLDHIALIMDSDDAAETSYVSIMTMHAAKGLEFEVVFLPSFEEGMFPSERTISESGEKGLEEERRLAYVAVTRAKKKLYISYALNRLLYGKWQNNAPSRFLAEIPAKYIEDIDKGLSHQILSEKKHNFSYKRKESMVKVIPGQEVFHKTYGTGTVVDVDGDKLDIRFDMHGFRKIKADFVEVL